MLFGEDAVKKIICHIEHIGTSPHVTLKLLKKTSEKDYSADVIANIIGSDATVASQVLKKANSVFYRRMGKCETIKQAVVKLGEENIKRIVFAIEMIGKYCVFHHETNFDEKQFWKHTLAGALISSKYAAFKNLDEDKTYVTTLFRNLGVLAIRQYMPIEFGYILEVINNSEVDFATASRAVIGVSHRKVTHMIISEWKLPISISDALNEVWYCKKNDNEVFNIKRSMSFADTLLFATSFEKWDTYFMPQNFDFENIPCEKIYKESVSECENIFHEYWGN
jgi:HD-like signal output (HDOD) protein